MPTHAQIIDTADQLFAAIADGDADAVTALWSDDVTVWHTGDERDNDKARALKVIRWYVGASSTSCIAPTLAVNNSPCGYAWS